MIVTFFGGNETNRKKQSRPFLVFSFFPLNNEKFKKQQEQLKKLHEDRLKALSNESAKWCEIKILNFFFFTFYIAWLNQSFIEILLILNQLIKRVSIPISTNKYREVYQNY